MFRLPALLAFTAILSTGNVMAQSEIVAIDVLIEPEAVMADRARELNARLRLGYPQGNALDATHVPHISLLHRYTRRADLAALNAAVAKIVAHSALEQSKLRATGYELQDAPGKVTVSINVQRTPQLQALQAELAAAVAPFAVPSGGAAAFVRSPGPPEIDQFTIDYVAAFVPARMGANWSPHVTIGSATARDAAALRNVKFEPFEFGIERFAVYQLGNGGTARLRLWPP